MTGPAAAAAAQPRAVSPTAVQSVPARFARVAGQYADRIAVSGGSSEWTYAELDRRSTALAIQILNRLGEKAEVVALLLDHDAPLIAAILAVLKAGKLYLALDPADTAGQLETMLADSQARLVVTDRVHSPQAAALARDAVQVLEFVADPGQSETGALPEVSPDAGAWLMYTSGSTGQRKGVWQNHRGIVHHAEVYRDLIQLAPEDRASLLTSCSLSASGTPLFAALLSGAALCPFHLRAHGVDRLAHWIQEQRITVYHSVPTVFRHLVRAANNRQALESLRLVRLGGEPLLRGDVELYRQHCPEPCRLMNSFSSTETGLISAFLIGKETPLPAGPVPIGRPVRGVEIFLADAEGKPVAAGKEGRIAVRSAFLRQGYWQRPELTAETFLPGAGDPRSRTFITQDLGKILPDGMLEHLGRADRIVKIRGLRADLAEVEAALCATGLVDEAAVIAVEEASGDRQLAAYVIPRGAGLSAIDCRRALQAVLPEHLVPRDVVLLEQMPRTAGGKTDWQALPGLKPAIGSSSSRSEPPRDGFEKKLAAIWQSVLGLEAVGRRDDFFDLGGTSLQAARVLARIEERLSVPLPASALVRHSTIEALAIQVSDCVVKPSTTSLVTLQATDSGRPLFLVHSGRGDVSMYVQLARRLPGRPVYGFQSAGIDGERLPLTSIPVMARRYLEAMRAQDPTGPYLLGGSGLGALIAFEMATQLEREGRPVGLLVLFDFKPAPPRARVSRRLKLATDGVRDAARLARWSAFRAFGRVRKANWLTAYRGFVARMNCGSRLHYWPGFYSGKATLFLTDDAKFLPGDRKRIFARYAREFSIVPIPGERVSMFAPPTVNELARQLQTALDV